MAVNKMRSVAVLLAWVCVGVLGIRRLPPLRGLFVFPNGKDPPVSECWSPGELNYECIYVRLTTSMPYPSKRPDRLEFDGEIKVPDHCNIFQRNVAIRRPGVLEFLARPRCFNDVAEKFYRRSVVKARIVQDPDEGVLISHMVKVPDLVANCGKAFLFVKQNWPFEVYLGVSCEQEKVDSTLHSSVVLRSARVISSMDTFNVSEDKAPPAVTYQPDGPYIFVSQCPTPEVKTKPHLPLSVKEDAEFEPDPTDDPENDTFLGTTTESVAQGGWDLAVMWPWLVIGFAILMLVLLVVMGIAIICLLRSLKPLVIEREKLLIDKVYVPFSVPVMERSSSRHENKAKNTLSSNRPSVQAGGGTEDKKSEFSVDLRSPPAERRPRVPSRPRTPSQRKPATPLKPPVFSEPEPEKKLSPAFSQTPPIPILPENAPMESPSLPPPGSPHSRLAAAVSQQPQILATPSQSLPSCLQQSFSSSSQPTLKKILEGKISVDRSAEDVKGNNSISESRTVTESSNVPPQRHHPTNALIAD